MSSSKRILRTLVSRRKRAGLIAWLVFAALVGVVSWDLGLNVGHALLLASLIAAAGIIQLCIPELDVPDLPELPTRDADGVRHDVVTLSFAIRGEKGVVREAAVLRVREIAERRLAAHGLDIHNPAQRDQIERLIGSEAYGIVGPQPSLPTQRGLAACLDALDHLTTNSVPHNSLTADAPATSAPSTSTAR